MARKFSDRDRITDLDLQVQGIQDQLSRIPVRFASTASAEGEIVTTILGRTISPFTTSDAYILVDNIDVITGTDPRTNPADPLEQVAVRNTFSEDYTDNELVWAIQRDDNDEFETDKTGEGSGDNVVHFELTQDKSPTDTNRTALRVLENGTLDDPANFFYVLDNSARFSGKAAWAGAYESDRGYRGYAVLEVENFQSTGRSGWQIIEMEQPTLGFVCDITEVFPRTSPKSFTVNRASLQPLEQQGSGRYPQQVIDTEQTFTVSDPGNVADGGNYTGALVIWSVDEDDYILAAASEDGLHVIKGQTTKSIDPTLDPTFTLENLVAIRGRLPYDANGVLSTVTVTNAPAVMLDSGADCWAAWNASIGAGESDRWDTGDAHNFLGLIKGLGGYTGTAKQAIWVDADDDIKWRDLVSDEKVLEDYAHATTEFPAKTITTFEVTPTTPTDLPTAACP